MTRWSTNPTEGRQKNGGQKDQDGTGFIFLPAMFLPSDLGDRFRATGREIVRRNPTGDRGSFGFDGPPQHFLPVYSGGEQRPGVPGVA